MYQAQEGLTALMLAVLQGQVGCVHMLLEGGASKDTTDDVRDATCRFRMLCTDSSMLFRVYPLCGCK